MNKIRLNSPLGSALISSTSNNICGDRPLGAREKFRYFLNCLRDNLRVNSAPEASFYDGNLHLPPLEEIVNDVSLRASPSRLYSEALWRTLPWRRISEELVRMRVLELGCGSGSRFGLLARVLGPSLVRYVGVDIRHNDGWDDISSRDGRAEFLQMPIEELPPTVLREVNLIISQSVLEHVKGDLSFFMAHRESMPASEPLLQAHVVPAESSLLLGLLHGYRQYTRGAVGRIAALYPDTRCCVLSLGGMLSDLLHLVAITTPAALQVPYLGRRPRAFYSAMLRACYARERSLKARWPSFYAFTLESGLKYPLLNSTVE